MSYISRLFGRTATTPLGLVDASASRTDDRPNGAQAKQHDFPQSSEEARMHIESIKKEKLVAMQSSIARAFNAVLKESAHLYADPAHFLFELIQNADDNEYAVDVPRMNITYREGFNHRYLRIDCNEIGFRRSDVESICSLSESSKAKNGRRGKYIGEKGMGFKSVFAVSDIVWIRSGYYSFKFVNNDSQKLGMIIPHWEPFPQKIAPKHTSILLELSPGKATEAMINKLKSMDPTCLLFLRQLREINISIRKSGRIDLSRRDEGIDKSGLHAVTVYRGKSYTDFCIFRQKVAGLPNESRRQGLKETDLVLAFPIGGSSIPIKPRSTQSVHAFLPIRDHGFKFAIHADFILVASREDLDPSPWNAAIIDQLPQAFLNAVMKLNESSNRYRWLQFVPTHTGTGAFENVPLKMLDLLSKKPILESQTGRMTVPFHLRYVPGKFRDARGELIVPSTYSPCVSEEYPVDQQHTLARLSAEQMTAKLFLKDIVFFVTSKTDDFQARPHTWHAEFAKILVSLINSDIFGESLKETISGLKIFPLRDGRWISSKDGTMLWPASSNMIPAPGGIDVLELHSAIRQHPNREALAQLLGAVSPVEREVCEIITRTHLDPKFQPDAIADEDLISHVTYLLKANWRPHRGEKVDMWFVAENGTRHRGTAMYMDSNMPYTATRVLKDRSRFHFIDKRYGKVLCKEKGWQQWLSQHLQLTIIPRMVVSERSTAGKFTLSDDFRYLLNHKSSQTVILLLREWWSYYEKWIVKSEAMGNDTADKASMQRVRDEFSSWNVLCRDGVKAPLSHTLLPRKRVLLANRLSLEETESGSGDMPNAQDHKISDTVQNEGTSSLYIGKNRAAVDFLATLLGKNARPTEKRVTEGINNHEPRIPEQIATLTQSQRSEAIQGFTVKLEFCLLLLQIRLPFTLYVLVVCISIWLLRVLNMLHAEEKRRSQGLYAEPAIKTITLGEIDWPTETILPRGQSIDCSYTIHSSSTMRMVVSKELLLLDVPDPEDKRWDFLEHLGVVIKMEHQKFLDRLREVQYKSPPKEFVETLYEQLEDCASEAMSSKIRQAFVEEQLVFIPRSSGYTKDKWVTIEDCVWEGPACLESIPCLKHIYPARSVFFQSVLQCTYANIATLVEEARTIKSSDSPERITGILFELRNVLKRDESKSSKTSASEITALRHCRMFPTNKGMHTEYRELQSADDENTWYIPDNSHLAGLFRSKVSLLAVNTQTAHDLMPLFKALRMRHQLLSVAATKVADAEGDPQPDPAYTRWLRSRVKYIQGLVPFISEREEILAALRTIEVFSIDEVVVKWTIKDIDGSVRVESTTSGRAALINGNQELQIFVAEDDSGEGNSLFELLLELSDFCRIREAHLNLLSLILNQDSREIVEYYLRREGILFDEGYADDEFECAFDKRPRRWGRTTASYKSSSRELRQTSPKDTFKEMRDGVIILPLPSMSFNKGNSKDTKFVGQLFVSKVLERVLGNDYTPENHWFSPLRTRAGHKVCQHPTKSKSAFIFQDGSGKFTKFLSKRGYSSTSFLCARPTYYIDVYVSEDNSSTFKLRKSTIKRAQDFTLVGAKENRVAALLIIARLRNVYHNASMTLFVDPWQLHVGKQLSLSPLSGSLASFEDDAPAISIPGYSPEKKDGAGIYHHSLNPLTEMRLLELYPGSADSPLRGKIISVPIDSPGKFVALSYVWGYVPSTFAPIYFETQHGKILITVSLASLLLCLRRINAGIRIWVDAICINQENTFEKSLQIRRMGDIYRSAEKVIAWLGTEEANSQAAMDFLARLSRIKSPSPTAAQFDLPDIYDSIWADVNALLNRNWFTRCWIVQELVFGSQVSILCGNAELEWESFFAAIELCDKHLTKPFTSTSTTAAVLEHAGPAFALGQTRRHLQDQHKKFTLLELMEAFSHTNATLEQDKLFALRGLAYDVGAEIFNPVYDTSLEDAIRQYAIGFVKTNQAIDLLYRAGISKSYYFSSWIPYWTRKDFPQTISTWPCEGGEFYAGQRTSVKASLRTYSPKTLEVEGFFIDKIIGTKDIRLGSSHFITFVNAMADFNNAIRDLGRMGYPTGETPQELKLRIPIGNAKIPQPHYLKHHSLAHRSFREPSSDRWPKDLEHYIFSVHEDQDAAVYESKPRHVQEVVSQYWQTASALSKRMGGYKFAVTKRGYAGLVPIVANTGDKVILFHGGKVPFLLRDNGDHFALVGECYIHGIMHGEGLALEDVEKRLFALR